MKSRHRTTYIQSASWLLVALLSTIIAGCVSVGSDYIRPDVPVNKDWNALLKSGSNSNKIDEQALAAWWSVLRDPILSALIAFR